MSIIEIQFRQDIFFNILSAQVIRQNEDLKRENNLRLLFSELTSGRLVDRLEPGQAKFADPNSPYTHDDAIVFEVPFTLHHTTFADARVAGSLKVPATQKLACSFFIGIEGQRQDAGGKISVNLNWGSAFFGTFLSSLINNLSE